MDSLGVTNASVITMISHFPKMSAVGFCRTTPAIYGIVLVNAVVFTPFQEVRDPCITVSAQPG